MSETTFYCSQIEAFTSAKHKTLKTNHHDHHFHDHTLTVTNRIHSVGVHTSRMNSTAMQRWAEDTSSQTKLKAPKHIVMCHGDNHCLSLLLCVMCIKWAHTALIMSACVHDSTWESLDRFRWNLEWALCCKISLSNFVHWIIQCKFLTLFVNMKPQSRSVPDSVVL